MLETIKIRNDKFGPNMVKILEKRRFEAYYCSTKQDALEKALSIIPQNHVVGWGGSMTIDSIGLKQKLSERGNILLDRDKTSSEEERVQLMKQVLTCDTFLMSSNAITQDGELFNIDGAGNRVAALCYGPQSVVIVAGMNKIVKNLDEAYYKVRNFTAPSNTQRFTNMDLPCRISGECSDCVSLQCCCCQIVTTRVCKPQGRIKIILVGEDLGI